MRRTRFMSWFFLVLSLAFFMVRDFRYALEAPLADYYWQSQLSFAVLMEGTPPPSRLENLYTLQRYVTTEKLIALADQAVRAGDSDFVAFAALNLPPSETQTDGLRLADSAVRANPKLTWIYFFLGTRALYADRRSQNPDSIYDSLDERANALIAFDPGNTVPHLFKAQMIQARRGKSWPSFTPYKKGPADPEYLNALAQETEWRKEMDAAFAAPRYESYYNQNFDLLRRVLLQRHWDHPAVVVTLFETVPIPNLLWLRTYANLLVLKFGVEAEGKGRLNEAIDFYRRTDSFANRVRLQAPTLIERLIAVACQLIAHERLIPALKKAGKQTEADLLTYEDQQTKEDLKRNRFIYGGNTHEDWSVLLVCISAGLVVAFALLTVLLVLYVNAKRWIRADKKGRLFEFLTTAENYAPILLFASCLSLYLNFVPYARDFNYYMTTTNQYSTFPPQFNAYLYPQFDVMSNSHLVPANAFMDYVPYALAGLLILTIVTAVSLLRKARSRA